MTSKPDPLDWQEVVASHWPQPLLALVDASHSDSFYELLKAHPELQYESLFTGGPDESAITASPFLIQITEEMIHEGHPVLSHIQILEKSKPAVLWFLSNVDFDCFTEVLKKRLYIWPPVQGEHPVLFHFYDVRHSNLAFEFFAQNPMDYEPYTVTEWFTAYGYHHRRPGVRWWQWNTSCTLQEITSMEAFAQESSSYEDEEEMAEA